MSTLPERVNNAIVRLDFLAPSKPAGVRTAIADLAVHWLAFWNSAERRLLPPATLHAKVARYAKWYTRAFALVPAAVQAKVPHPQTLDATVWAAWEDQLSHMAEGDAAAGQFAAENLKKLQTELAKAHDVLMRTVLIVGGVATAALLAYAFAKIAR
jgi:hypothetical protein